jgi:hypothetical protein
MPDGPCRVAGLRFYWYRREYQSVVPRRVALSSFVAQGCRRVAEDLRHFGQITKNPLQIKKHLIAGREATEPGP